MHKLQLTMLPGEYWYGGHTNYGYLMPVNAKKVMLVDTTVVRSYGQANTLFVSNKGRVFGRSGLRPIRFRPHHLHRQQSQDRPVPGRRPHPARAHITMR